MCTMKQKVQDLEFTIGLNLMKLAIIGLAQKNSYTFGTSKHYIQIIHQLK